MTDHASSARSRLQFGRAATPGEKRVPAAARTSLRRSTSVVRVIFGFVWAVDAYFKWQPAFRAGYVGMIADAAKGQPSWLVPWFRLWQSVFALAPNLFAFGIAVGETLLALALIAGFARKLTFGFGALWSILIWTTAEGFGKSHGVPTDIGTAIIYAVVFLALLALDARWGTRALSVDAMIERRVPWWDRVAEVRR